jgi:hypothetical protein
MFGEPVTKIIPIASPARVEDDPDLSIRARDDDEPDYVNI